MDPSFIYHYIQGQLVSSVIVLGRCPWRWTNAQWTALNLWYFWVLHNHPVCAFLWLEGSASFQSAPLPPILFPSHGCSWFFIPVKYILVWSLGLNFTSIWWYMSICYIMNSSTFMINLLNVSWKHVFKIYIIQFESISIVQTRCDLTCQIRSLCINIKLIYIS